MKSSTLALLLGLFFIVASVTGLYLLYDLRLVFWVMAPVALVNSVFGGHLLTEFWHLRCEEESQYGR